MYPPECLRQWLEEYALSYSSEEIIEPWKQSPVKHRRKLVLAKNKRRGENPPVCKVYHERSPGKWKPADVMGKAGTMVWKTGDKRAREEPTSRAIIRHWKIWRGDRVLTASFFRVGAKSGAHIMSPGGEVETICQPPMESEPLATVSAYQPYGVYLERVELPNPERPRWDEWTKTILAVRAFVDNEVRENVAVDIETVQQCLPECVECGKWEAKSVDRWHVVYGDLWCPACYRRMGTRAEGT